MKIKNFETFLRLLGEPFSINLVDDQGKQWVSVYPITSKFRDLEEIYRKLKLEILTLKGNLDLRKREIFDAKLNSMEVEINKKLFRDNYNEAEVNSILQKFGVSESEFWSWNERNDFQNQLYLILSINAYWGYPEEYEEEKSQYSFLSNVEHSEFQVIKHFFEHYIKHQYQIKILNFIQEQKFFLVNDVNKYYPFRKSDYFEMFKKYTKQHIIDPYVDHSYLFQRMRDLNYIENITHFDYMDWLKQEGFITTNVYNDFKIKGGFRSLSKAYSVGRENNFNLIFKL